MIKGSIKSDPISSDNLLRDTNGGYDIMRFYIGKDLKRQMNRPWGRKEKKMSWGVFPANGIWYWKDQANEETGTAIQFVQKFFNLSFKEAVDKIAWDFFGKGDNGLSNINPVKITWEKPEEIEKEYAHISFESKPFTKKHHEFWNCVDVSETWCNKYECWAVKRAAVNRKMIPIGSDEIVFAYYAPDIDSVKLYFPEREKNSKFLTNCNYNYLWNYSNISECDNLIIAKSNKDMIVTALLSECIISTMAEAVKIFNKETVDKINSITKTPWIWYGSDWDGVKKCKEITDTNKWKYINTETKYLPEINDQYGLVKMWNQQNPGSGMKNLELFMKKKGLLK